MPFVYFYLGDFDAWLEQEPYGIAAKHQELNRRPYVTADGYI
jgi:hypothetical protein